MDLALSTLIGKHFLVSNAIIKLMTEFILALIKVRDVNLTSIALLICGKSQVESGYRKLQRFFANTEICYVCLAKLIVNLAKIGDKKWVLVLDRTSWKFGQLNINILVLSIDRLGIGVPILWSMLDNNGGSSNSLQRQDLINRFIEIFGVEVIGSLLGDREFIGDRWLKFLADKGIYFYIRIRSDITIGRAEDELVTANNLVKNLGNDESLVLKGKRYLGRNYHGPKVKIAACRNDKGELMIIATNDNADKAITMYRQRWSIETLFSCLKTRGFNFENTHMLNLDRIEKLLGLLAIAFTLCHILGIWQNEIKKIKLKTHKRKAKSLFRYGLDYLQKLLLYPNLMKTKLREIIDKFLSPDSCDLNSLFLC
jgi:hypothetical protein